MRTHIPAQATAEHLKPSMCVDKFPSAATCLPAPRPVEMHPLIEDVTIHLPWCSWLEGLQNAYISRVLRFLLRMYCR
jgi:hypothetical protein